MSFVIAHPALVLDQLAHPARGPQPRGVSERLGSALERVFDLLELSATKSRFASRASGLFQTLPPRLRKLPRPANHRLSMHAQAARHLTLTHAPPKQFRCFHPAALQRAEVPPHTRWVTHTRRLACVSILYKTQ